MRILLINQFVPPESPPTARLLGDLAESLQAQGHEVDFIGAANNYRQSASGLVARLFRDLRAHAVLIWHLLSAGRADWILCLSDPPGLPFTCAVVAKLKAARFAHWAMDVYPDVAVALGVLPEGLLARGIRRLMHTGYNRADLLVALDQDMADRMGVASTLKVKICPPWPPTPTNRIQPASAIQSLRQHYPQCKIWLYSGNLGRAHEYECLLAAQAELEQAKSPWHLIFQGGGPCREEAKAAAEKLGLQQCLWLPYASDDEFITSLLDANVLVATQKESTRGMLWPSKLALMTLVDRPIVWVGPIEGSIARELTRYQPTAVAFSPNQKQELIQWLSGVDAQRSSKDLPGIHTEIADKRHSGLRLWEEWLTAGH